MENNFENNFPDEPQSPKTDDEELPVSEKTEKELWDAKTEKLRQNIDDILGNLPHGLIVSINRVRPRWCKGWQESITIDAEDNESFSREYIKDMWGGGTYMLTFHFRGRYAFSRQIDIGGPPREEGRILEHPDVVAEQKKLQGQFALYQSQNQPQLSEKLIELLFKNNTSKELENFKLMRETLKNSQPQTKISEYTELFELMEKLKDFQGNHSTEKSDEITPMILGLLELLKQTKNHPAQIRNPSQLPTHLHKASPSPHISTVPSKNDDDDEEMTLGEELANLDATEFNNVLLETFEKMSPEKRQSIFQYLAGSNFQHSNADDEDSNGEQSESDAGGVNSDIKAVKK